MSKVDLWIEIADFFASRPSREAISRFRPSPAAQKRASELLEKNREGSLTKRDRRDLNEFTRAEMFMRLVKAKVLSQNRE